MARFKSTYGSRFVIAVVSLVLWPCTAFIGAQSRVADGPAFTPARTPEGKPNLNGIWQTLSTAAWDIQDHHARGGVPAGQSVVEGNELPYQPWALTKKTTNFENRWTDDPETKCYLPGVPRATYMPFPFEITQTETHILISYEYVHASRTIYLDGRKRAPDMPEFWMGDSRGHWDGDTLVVDVANFTDKTWFDRAGNFHSAALHVIERYTMIDPHTIMYHVTIEEPQVFTRPWTMSMPLYRRRESNVQLLEYECNAYLEDAYLADEAGKKKP